MSEAVNEQSINQNRVPYTDWEERFRKYNSEEIREICRSLSDGELVIVNKRETPLRVRTVEDCRDLAPIELGDTGYALDIGPDGFCVHLEGHGTRYEIHVPENETQGTMMYWPSGEQIVGYIDTVKDGEIHEPQLRSSIRAADMLDGELR